MNLHPDDVITWVTNESPWVRPYEGEESLGMKWFKPIAPALRAGPLTVAQILALGDRAGTRPHTDRKDMVGVKHVEWAIEHNYFARLSCHSNVT